MTNIIDNLLPQLESTEPNPVFEQLAYSSLKWLPALGIGYFEVVNLPYDDAYFEKYANMAQMPIGLQLNKFRTQLAEHWFVKRDAAVIDVGIGSGTFICELVSKGWPSIAGYDINPAGIAWLRREKLWGDLYGCAWRYGTFWDSLEHIRDPVAALNQIKDTAIVSLPIFRDADHAILSKHYRTDEHYWYFTRNGFVNFAGKCGFKVSDILASETAIGREDIETFVLTR